VRIFSVRLAWESGAHVFDGLSDIALGAVGGSTEEHLLEEVSSTWSLEGLVTGSSANENTNGSSLVAGSLSGNSDTIWESCDLYL
jgi:hypothetical protein